MLSGASDLLAVECLVRLRLNYGSTHSRALRLYTLGAFDAEGVFIGFATELWFFVRT